MKFRKNVGQGNERRRVRATLDLTPLIDVVFQLLVFFMLTSTFVVQTSLPIQMPQAQGASKLESKDVTVTLTANPGGPDGDGEIYVDEEPILDWAEMTRLLVAAREAEPEVIVLIRPDARIDVGRLVRVTGICYAAGISKIAVAAERVEALE